MEYKNERDGLMKKFYFSLIAIFVFTISLLFLISYKFLTGISYQEGFSLKQNRSLIKKNTVIKIGVVSRYSPSLIYDGYQPIIDYLNKTTPYRFKLVLSKNYTNTVKQLKEGKINFAFLGNIVFITNRKKLNLIPVVCPLNSNGTPFLKATIIVRDDSKINSFCQLNNKKIALPSKLSFSSKWGKLKAKQCGINAVYKEFNFHHTVVLQVLNRVCSAGVVREYVAEEFKGNGIKIIDYSPLIPSPPLVALPSSNKKLIKTVQKSLLEFKRLNTDALIDKEFYFGFTIPDKTIYDNFETFLKKSGILNEK